MKERKNITLLRKALQFCIKAHDGVYRKFSGKEYAHHPVEVAKIVRKFKRSKNIEILLVAALLHDTVEDVDWVTLDVIREEFGEFVASLVDELTSDDDKIKEMGKTNYLKDKMVRMTSYGLVIKLADRLHNCSDLENGSDKFRTNYVSSTRTILNELDRRYLTNTHVSLIKQIEEKISVFE